MPSITNVGGSLTSAVALTALATAVRALRGAAAARAARRRARAARAGGGGPPKVGRHYAPMSATALRMLVRE
jgi:hypothetical protein